MSTEYKGFRLEVKREESMGGWENLYLTVEHIADGWYLVDEFTEAEDSESDAIGWLMAKVDDYYSEVGYAASEGWHRLLHAADKAVDAWLEFQDFPDAYAEHMDHLDSLLREYGKGSAKYDPELWSI